MNDVQDKVLRFLRSIKYWYIYFVTIATAGATFSLQFTKNCLAAGLSPDPLGELKRSPRPPSRKTGGLLLRGGEGREGKGIGWEGREQEGRGRGGEKREEKGRIGGGEGEREGDAAP